MHEILHMNFKICFNFTLRLHLWYWCMPKMSNSPVKALVERFRTVADHYPTSEATTESAGVRNPQFYRYLTGRAVNSLIFALRLAEPLGDSMDRLATGDGKMYANVEPPNQE